MSTTTPRAERAPRRNLEFKARCPDLAAAERAAASLGARRTWVRRQVDTYFPCATGRMKLRQAGPPDGPFEEEELILYERADAHGARVSRYHAVAVLDGARLAALLAEAFGVIARVVKVRTLLLLGTTRIHLDRVEGLGEFVEVERPLAPEEDLAGAEGEVARIATALGVGEGDIVPVSNVDLAIAARRGGDASEVGRGL